MTTRYCRAIIISSMKWNAEVRAATVLLAVAGLGAAVRTCGAPTESPGAVWSAPSEGRADPDSVAARAARLAAPLGATEQVDVNRATAAELARLPRVGPALAARIVAFRDTAGAFSSLEALGRVPGVGPGTLSGLAPHVNLGAVPAAASLRPTRIRVNIASAAELQALPGIGPALAAAIVADRAARGPFRTPEDLDRVRGVGPALVDRLRGRILLP